MHGFPKPVLTCLLFSGNHDFSLPMVCIQKHQPNTSPGASLRFITAKAQLLFLRKMQIREFQEMMKNLYFKRDNERGIEGTFNWLVDEVAELGEELKGSDKESTEREFADVIAWLASLANIMGIDLEKAALNKYNHECPKCRRAPCECAF